MVERVLDIRSTIAEALRRNGLSGYEQQAQPVVAVLEDRERDLANRLVGVAVDEGWDRENVVQVLRDAGMTMPTPTAVSGNGHGIDEDDREKLTQVRHELTGLLERIDGLIG